MRVALVADAFPPLRSSAAVQLRDLSAEFARQGHEVTVIVASPDLEQAWKVEMWQGVRVFRARTPRTKDVNYVRRTISEFLMPYAMVRQMRRSPLRQEQWDGVVWYSPTIFLAPIVKALKRKSGVKSYLIIRDIFPEWALDMGLMGPGVPYRFFRHVANAQYAAADVIGVQTPGNLSYFRGWQAAYPSRRLEVLQNWLADPIVAQCSIDVAQTRLAGRKIFIYAGNMGVAQGMDILIDLAAALKQREDVGFLFVGRGSDANRIREEAKSRSLDNVLFFDEIDPDEIPGLYAQAHVGLVALDPRHKTHNIPGKFLSYMHCGLPVLAIVNLGNDMEKLVNERRVGRVCSDRSISHVADQANSLLAEIESDCDFGNRCRHLAQDQFSAAVAVCQIVASLQV